MHKVAKLNLAIFISGRGSNMRSLVEACKDENFPARVSLILSNKAEAAGLKYAAQQGIETLVLNHKDYDSREAFDQAMLDTLDGRDIDLICLAGFMRLLTPVFVEPWQGRMINIHPSLLPAYKGLDTHARVIAAGENETGCTVHYVVPEMDAGPIIVQKTVPVLPDDSEDVLAARVLEQEHIAYPEAVGIVAQELRGG